MIYSNRMINHTLDDPDYGASAKSAKGSAKGAKRSAESGKEIGAARSTRKNQRFVDDYLPALLARASHLISTEFHQVVGKSGFTVSEWRVLASLEGGKAISIGRLAAVSLNKQSTLTRMLDRMEERGHIERVPHEGGDRRVTLVRITPHGSLMVSQLITQARKHAEQVLEPFGEKRANELKAMLRTIIELHQDGASDP
jgi:DNA-binding MarR family transcriptional regulator